MPAPPSPADDASVNGDEASADDDASTDDSGDDGAASGPDGVSRRTLVRILIGLGIGIPVAIELRTILNLVGSWLGGDGDETPSATPRADAVGIGEELLPETVPVERLRSAEVTATDGEVWPFTVIVDVENASERPYAFELGAVTTRDGNTVAGGTATDRLAPGESTTLATTWSLPEGATPHAIDVRGELFGEETPQVIERSVALRGVPVDG